jgi:virginiamycin A acetyltransferase
MMQSELGQPDPSIPYPSSQLGRRLGLVKNFVTNPQVTVGDFTGYIGDPDAADFERDCLVYAHPALRDHLTIGKFTGISHGVKFHLSAGNHAIDNTTAYLFPVMDFVGWRGQPGAHVQSRGDIVIGNDVWLAADAIVMPGVTIGDGAIIGAYSVVSRDVRPYAVVVGNPAREVRRRFSDDDIEFLLAVRWWDWPVEKITRYIPILSGEGPAALRLALEADGEW